MRRARQLELRVPRPGPGPPGAPAGGRPVSSAILYLAIIAIWACVLIPRWLKRDTSQAKKSKSSRELPADADADARGTGVQMADDAGRGGAADELDDGRDEFAGYEPSARAADSE